MKNYYRGFTTTRDSSIDDKICGGDDSVKRAICEIFNENMFVDIAESIIRKQTNEVSIKSYEFLLGDQRAGVLFGRLTSLNVLEHLYFSDGRYQVLVKTKEQLYAIFKDFLQKRGYHIPDVRKEKSIEK